MLAARPPGIDGNDRLSVPPSGESAIARQSSAIAAMSLCRDVVVRRRRRNVVQGAASYFPTIAGSLCEMPL
ncbi:MAG: hypothetical protein ABWY07_02870 [Burkholderiales bacterium]